LNQSLVPSFGLPPGAFSIGFPMSRRPSLVSLKQAHRG
jgi:hypothetical protein